MNAVPSNPVRPIVRALAGVFGVAFALAGLLTLALLAYTIWDGLHNGRMAWKLIAITILVPVGAYSLARIFLEVAVTGENPRFDEDDEPE